MAVTDIRDLLGRRKDEVKPPSLEETQPPAAQTTGSPAAVAYVKLKNKLHHRILEKVDLVSLESMSESKLRQEIATLVELLLTEDPAQINDIERRMLVRDIQNEMLGLGPLELLMADFENANDPQLSGQENFVVLEFLQQKGGINLYGATHSSADTDGEVRTEDDRVIIKFVQ